MPRKCGVIGMEKEIKVQDKDTLESIIYTLMASKARGEKAFCIYRGIKLHSDDIELKNAIPNIKRKEVINKDERKFEEFKEKLDILEEKEKEESRKEVSSYIERGNKIIYEEKQGKWMSFVKCSFYGLYSVREVTSSLMIMEILENTGSINRAKKVLNKQACSGVSIRTMRDIVFEYSKKGPEFYLATANNISPKILYLVAKKRIENMKLEAKCKNKEKVMVKR